MAGRERISQDIDPSVAAHVAAMSVFSQRWLKTVLYTITTVEPRAGGTEGEESLSRARTVEAPPAAPAEAEEPTRRPASLEDVITGEADLREHLDAYPELAEELDGLADIIDMLREAGEQRRRRGEQILREEILGEKPEAEEGEEPT